MLTVVVVVLVVLVRPEAFVRTPQPFASVAVAVAVAAAPSIFDVALVDHLLDSFAPPSVFLDPQLSLPVPPQVAQVGVE